MKLQRLTEFLTFGILLLSLIIISCNTTEKINKFNSDKITGQLIKETKKIKGCIYSDGSICTQACCKTGNACDNQPYSYRRCDFNSGVWYLEQYKNSDCGGSCTITNTEKYTNKENIEGVTQKQTEITGSVDKQKSEIVRTIQSEEGKIVACSSGWKCKDTNYKGYQLSDCSWLGLEYCKNGCEYGKCKIEQICTPDTFKCDGTTLRKCNKDGSYLDYYEFCFEGCENDKCLSKKAIIEPIKETTPSTSTIVSEVIDGDTIKLNSGDSVRLIGMNAPEAGQYYYLEAKNKLKELIKGKTVTLEKDISNTDRYGRLLRYISVGDVLVNLEIVKLGYAEAYKYPPDVKYSNLFEEFENEAKAKGLGIWKKENINYIVDKCFNVINFHYDAAGNDNYNLNDEYFTLENSCSYSIDLTGWTIKDEASHIYTFSSFNSGANSKVTIYTGFGQYTQTELYWKMSSAVWNNDGDTLFLRDNKGNLVLEKTY